MKILYVGTRHSYDSAGAISKQLDSHDFIVWYSSLKKFRPDQYIVVPFWFNEVMRDRGKEAMNQELLEVIRKGKPDFSFFAVGADELTFETLKSIQRMSGLTTIYICGDDSWRFESTSRHFAPFYTWTLTSEWRAIEKYKKIGCTNVIYYQSWPNLEIFKRLNVPKDIEVSFIGTGGPARAKVVTAVRKAGIPVLVRGRGWLEGEATELEMVELTARSKIALALNGSSFYFGLRSLARLFFKRSGRLVKPDFMHFFQNLQEWRGKLTPQIKGRMFEVPACGAMQIAEQVVKIESFYTPDKEIVIYKNTKELIEKLRYYLSHDTEREAIAQAGYQRTITDHTAQKRLESIFARIL
ncbi:MAG: glycosyltransferase [bacterium]|nr:glycosyltransferase [bacterium]